MQLVKIKRLITIGLIFGTATAFANVSKVSQHLGKYFFAKRANSTVEQTLRDYIDNDSGAGLTNDIESLSRDTIQISNVNLAGLQPFGVRRVLFSDSGFSVSLLQSNRSIRGGLPSKNLFWGELDRVGILIKEYRNFNLIESGITKEYIKELCTKKGLVEGDDYFFRDGGRSEIIVHFHYDSEKSGQVIGRILSRGERYLKKLNIQ